MGKIITGVVEKKKPKPTKVSWTKKFVSTIKKRESAIKKAGG